MIVVRDPKDQKSVTIMIKGGSKTIIDEAHRSIHDSLCVVRNLLKDPREVVGGGAAELNTAIMLREVADNTPTIE